MLVKPIGDLRLNGGYVLPDVHIAYEAFGRLNPEGDNAVLVTHGLTSGTDMLSNVAGTAEGSWAHMLGPGRALDIQRYFVVCSNVIGSSLGSTGPASARASTGRHWGPDFPALTLSDMVSAQRVLLDSLGVRRLRCVVGPSFGGMQALQWALDCPDAVDAIGVIVSGLNWPQELALGALRRRLQADGHWQEGWYASGELNSTMTALRYETLVNYGMQQLLEKRWPGQHEVIELALQSASRKWAEQFDANALLALCAAGQRFDVRGRLSEIRCPVLFVPARTDLIFPPLPAVRELLTTALPALTYTELDTPYGHSASGYELPQWEPALSGLLERAHGSTNNTRTLK